MHYIHKLDAQEVTTATVYTANITATTLPLLVPYTLLSSSGCSIQHKFTVYAFTVTSTAQANNATSALLSRSLAISTAPRCSKVSLTALCARAPKQISWQQPPSLPQR
jgi:hypothetical protein